MLRKITRTPKVEQARHKFISLCQEAALSMLASAEETLCDNPEKGTASSQKGILSMSLGVPERKPTFILNFSYAYNANEIQIMTFSWRSILRP